MRPRVRVWIAALLLGAVTTVASSAVSPPEEVASPFAATEEMRLRVEGKLPNSTVARMQALIDLIFAEEGGLGFEYRRRPTLTAAEAYTQRAGNCLSLVNLFVALARSSGLPAKFIEVEDYEVFYRDEGVVVRSDHIVGGVRIGGDLLTVDFLPGRPKRYFQLRPVSDRRATAHYYKAIATEALVDGDLDKSERYFDLALAVDPDFAATWNNLAILRRRQDNFAGAFEALERALAIDPELLPALENLSGLYRRTGEHAKAEEVNGRILKLRTNNPFFLVGEAARLIESGEIDDAEKLLNRARRLQSDIPEIFIYLAKVELARGRTKQADRLLRKARNKSEAFSQGFQTAIQNKINSLLPDAETFRDEG